MTSGVGLGLDVFGIIITTVVLFSPEIASRIDAGAEGLPRQLAAIPVGGFLAYSVIKALWDEASYWEALALARGTPNEQAGLVGFDLAKRTVTGRAYQEAPPTRPSSN